MSHPTPHRSKSGRRQEGAVLIIVLLMVMMAAGLGTFAVTNAMVETRAAGTMRQLQRTRRAGEGVLVAAGGFLAERGRNNVPTTSDPRWVGATNLQDSQGNYISWRAKFGLPSYQNDMSIAQVSVADMAGGSYPSAALPNDIDISAGAATPYVLDEVGLVEFYDMPTAAGSGGGTSGQPTSRAVVTAFTRLSIPTDSSTHQQDTVRSGDSRGLHESVSIARAFFDVR